MSELQTKREYLVGLGLAKPGKGRFNREANAALAKAEADGVVFADNKPSTTSTTADVPAVDASGLDFKDVRAWCVSNGITLGSRGRIPTEILAKYLEANGGKANDEGVLSAPVKAAVLPQPRVQVRPETVAWAIAQNPPGTPDYISKPVVAISNCGRCGEGVSFCTCSSGPYVPSFLVNGDKGVVALLEKPTV